MDGLTLKNYFISKGFLMVEVNESAIIDGNRLIFILRLLKENSSSFLMLSLRVINLSKEKFKKY